MTPNPDRQPLFARLRSLAATGPIVVAHRGNSRYFPENTLPAFAAARDLGAPVQEFDVQGTQDGELVCLHDPTLDRTTDAAVTLGPGALLTGLSLDRLQRLDAGRWKGAAHAGARVPTLAEALAAMLPSSIPMIEHKAGEASRYVAELQRRSLAREVLVQSFDWQFVAAVARATDEIALGLLGPTQECPTLGEAAIAAAKAIGAGFLHWHATEVTAAAVAQVHRAGLLLCTYTSDDELAWHGGRALGVDAMCTNDPARMLASLGAAAPRR